MSQPNAPASFGEECKALLRLALPLAGVHAGTQIMTLVDTAIIGHLGLIPIGAAGIGNGLFLSFSIFGLGIMLSLEPLISQALGAARPERAHSLLWQGIWLAVLVATIVASLLCLTPYLLVPMGISTETAALAKRYIWIRALGVFPYLLFAALRSFLQTSGFTKVLLLSSLAGNLINVVLAFLFSYGGASLPAWLGPICSIPPLGVYGVALATVFATSAQFLLALLAFPRTSENVSRRPNWSELGGFLRLGTPIGLQLASEAGVFTIAGILAGRLGDEALAAHQISLTLASVTYTMAIGIGAAGSVRVGYGVGAQHMRWTRWAGSAAFLLGSLWMSLGAMVFVLFPEALASWLTDNRVVIDATVPLLWVAAVFQLSDGAQAIGAGVLRGAGDTRFPFWANILGHYGFGIWVSLGLAFWLQQGVTGLWWGLCAGLSAVAAALLLRFFTISSKNIRPLENVKAHEST